MKNSNKKKNVQKDVLQIAGKQISSAKESVFTNEKKMQEIKGKTDLKESVLEATKNLIASNVARKHILSADHSQLSAKQQKGERSKNRRMLIYFANQHFTQKDLLNQIANAKLFVGYVKQHYSFDALTFSANDLYNAKDVRTITDIQLLIDFCKANQIALKVYQNV